MVGRPSDVFHRDLDLGFPAAGLARDGAILALTRWRGRDRDRGPVTWPGHKAVALSAIAPWRSCGPLFLAALPLNDSDSV
jgi:hypothetical protein